MRYKRFKIAPEIDRSVPPPPAHAPRVSRLYPFDAMQPGESLFIDDMRQANSMVAAMHHHARKHGWQVATRLEGNGRRAWRLK